MVNKSRFIQYCMDYSHEYARPLVGFVFSIMGKVLLAFNAKKLALKFLLASIRYSYSGVAISCLSKNMDRFEDELAIAVSEGVSEQEAFGRSIILSFPKEKDGVIVKGVFLITFTRTCAFFLRSEYFKKLDELFVFILEPSWAGYADPDLLSFINRAEHCYLEATEIKDRAFLNALYPSGVTLSFGAGNWVDETIFNPRNINKRYDSIYVANMNPAKRIYRYVEAIKNIVNGVDPNYRAILVCASWGSGSISEVQDYIEKNHLEENIELSSGLSQTDMMQRISESKSSILLSFKEGSSRILFESMMLDVPVICLSENIGVNKSYINENTGILISDRFLESALIALKHSWMDYGARNWAVRNISPAVTTEMLAIFLEEKLGGKCNLELYEKVNMPEVEYRGSNRSVGDINKKLFNCLDNDHQEIWQLISSLSSSIGKS